MAVNINGNSDSGLVIGPSNADFTPVFIDESEFAGGTSEDVVYLDTNATVHYDAVVTSDGYFELQNIYPIGLEVDFVVALNPTIATVDENHRLIRVGTGTAKFNVTAGGQTRQISVAVSSAAQATHYVYNSFVEGCYAKYANDWFAQRAAVCTSQNWNDGFKTGRIYLANAWTQFHQPYDPDYSVFQMQLNPNCWAADLDFSAFACYASGSVYNGPLPGNNMGVTATLISKRHFIGAGHYHPAVGCRLYFLDSDGEMVMRTVAALPTQSSNYMQIGSEQLDLCVGILDDDVPATVVPLSVMPIDSVSETYMPTCTGTNWITHPLYGIHVGRFRQVDVVGIIPSTSQYFSSFSSLYPPTDPGDVPTGYTYAPPDYPAMIGYCGFGDSGSAMCAIVDGQPCLAGIISAAFTRTTARYTSINAAMATLSNAAGLSAGEVANGNTPYQLTVADLSGFPTYE
jgi:hypothetical protein